jgi:hypothetical protein
MSFSLTLDETGPRHSTTPAPAIKDGAGNKFPIDVNFNDVMRRLSKIGDRLKQLDESRWSAQTQENPSCSTSTSQYDLPSWLQGHTYEQSCDLPNAVHSGSPKSSTTPALASAASSSIAVPPSRSLTPSFTPTVPFSSHDRTDLKASYGEPSEEECEQDLSTIEKIISRLTHLKSGNESLLGSEESRDSSRTRSEFLENKEQEHSGFSCMSENKGVIKNIARRLGSWQQLKPESKHNDLLRKSETYSNQLEKLFRHQNEGFHRSDSSTPSTVITVDSNVSYRQSKIADFRNIQHSKSILKVKTWTGNIIKEKLLTQTDQPDHFQAHVYFSYKRAGDIVPNLVLHLPKSWTFLKLVRKSLAEIQRRTSEENATNIIWVYSYHPNRNLQMIKENIRIIFGEKGVTFRGSNLKKEIGPYLTKFINKFWLQERTDRGSLF